MVSVGRTRGFGSDPPTGSGRVKLGGRHNVRYVSRHSRVFELVQS